MRPMPIQSFSKLYKTLKFNYACSEALWKKNMNLGSAIGILYIMITLAVAYHSTICRRDDKYYMWYAFVEHLYTHINGKWMWRWFILKNWKHDGFGGL